MKHLIEAQKAAHAAWVACPDKRRTEKAALAASLDAACRAVAAAKRAAAPPVTVDIDAALEAVAKRQRANAAVLVTERQLNHAGSLWLAAQEWPRCGEGWPYPGAEARADALLRENPAFAAGLEE